MIAESHGIPNGYKQTEVGVIPEDWGVVSLKEYAQVRSGIAKNANIKLKNPIRVPYLRVANVQDGFLDLSEMSEIDIERSDLRRFSVVTGDVLMNEGGDRDKLGRGCVWSGQHSPCVHQNHVFVVRCKANLYPHYLTAYTSTTTAKQFFINAGSQTTNLASINKTAISKLPIPLPPTLAEQEAIAEALGDVDALIESLEQLVAKKRHLKQAAMQQLLTGKIRLPGFEGEWEPKRLGNLGSTYGGLTGKTKSHFGHGSARYIPFMNIMYNVVIDPSDLDRVDVHSSEGQNAVEAGDLFFNGSSETPEEVGMCSFLAADLGRVYVNSFCFGFRFREGAAANGLFLAYYLRSQRGRDLLRSLAQGATRYNLSKTALMDIELEMPTPSEQDAITEVLTDMDTEIEAIEAKLAKARQIKQGMMQVLLTGQVRLVTVES